MNAKQEEYIRRNWREFTARQLAATLDLKRTEVEGVINSLREPLHTRLAAKAAVYFGPGPLQERRRLGALFAVALLLRLYYLYALGNTPFFEPLTNLVDDGVYNLRGREIAAGDWLGGPSWLIYTTPLYPYYLGLIYKIFGYSVGAAHFIQTFLGALTPLLVYGLAKEAFDSRRVPLVAGAICAVYVPFIFYENMLLGESLAIFLILCGLLLLARTLKKADGAPGTVFLTGLLFGITTLFRPNLLIPVGFCALYLGLLLGYKRKRKGLGAATALLLLAGLALGIAPVTLKNYRLYNDFVPISAHGGVNLYMAANPEKGGGFRPSVGFGTGMKEIITNSVTMAEQAEGRTLKPSEVSSYWSGRALENVRSSPFGFFVHMLRGAAYFLNRYEYPDTINMLFVAEFVPFLKPGAFSYGIVAVLALCGIALGLRKWGSAAWLLAVFAFTYSASVGMFFIIARYRVVVVPLFIIFAACGLEYAREAWLKKDQRRLVRFAALAALASVLVFYPVRQLRFAVPYNTLGAHFFQKGSAQQAELCYNKALRISPNFPDPYRNLSLLYRKAGDLVKAQAYEERYQVLKKIAMAGGK